VLRRTDRRSEGVLRTVLLAEPGAGSTTFVGLLYLAQTRLATERADAFRFSSPPESIRHLSVLYEQLVAGEFPAPLAPEAVPQIRLDMAYSSPTHWSPFHRATTFEARYRAECRWIRSGFDAVATALEGGASVPGTDVDLRSSTAPIFLLDPRHPDGGPEVGAAAASNRDDAILRILKELARGPGPRGTTVPGRLHPLFVITKSDVLPEDLAPTVRRRDLLDDDLPAIEGARIGRLLIDALAPQSAGFCRSSGPNVGEPSVFLSYVRGTVAPASGANRILTRTLPDHRHEPVYPFSQYRALVDHLGDLAGHEP
jgi:hypothetical protein